MPTEEQRMYSSSYSCSYPCSYSCSYSCSYTYLRRRLCDHADDAAAGGFGELLRTDGAAVSDLAVGAGGCGRLAEADVGEDVMVDAEGVTDFQGLTMRPREPCCFSTMIGGNIATSGPHTW